MIYNNGLDIKHVIKSNIIVFFCISTFLDVYQVFDITDSSFTREKEKNECCVAYIQLRWFHLINTNVA